MIRTFIAIDLSPEIKANLGALLSQIKSKGNYPVRWTSVENIHITLKFLGDVEEKLLPVLQTRVIDAIKGTPPFSLRIEQLGAFPRIEQPRIIWVGCELSEQGYRLQKLVDEATAEMGFPKEERPFSPHLTIGRLTNSTDKRDFPAIARMIHETPAENLGTQTTSFIRIYRSDLLPAGPKYRVLYEIPFS